jgi:hypothetical protein
MTKHDKPRDLVHGATPTTTAPIVTRVYIIRVYIIPGRFHRTRGRLYNAHLGSPDGEQIVTNALDVGHAACRALKARGITGSMETWHVGSVHPAQLFPDISEAAEWTVRECPKQGLRRVKYQPWSGPAWRGPDGSEDEDDHDADGVRGPGVADAGGRRP